MSTFVMPKFAEEVFAGAALLDQRHPGWYREIDLDILDLYSLEDCILGQFFGGYGIGTDVLGLDIPAQYSHGFDLPPSDGEPNTRTQRWVDLTDTWKVAIKRRLNKDVA